jgi:hypothetical protein
MDQELKWWQDNYDYAVRSTTADHLKGRFAARRTQLEVIRQRLAGARDELYAMPRLS